MTRSSHKCVLCIFISRPSLRATYVRKPYLRSSAKLFDQADANTGHAFGILMACVGTLRTFGISTLMRLPWTNDKDALSPYLRDPGRLGDVIAAIQAMATYKFYKLPFAAWADRMSADESQAEKWKTVFLEHPEFFRLDSAREKASLVWRRQFPRRYDVDAARILTNEEYEGLNPEKKLRVSRVPLSSSDIKALVDTAVNLHSRALEHQKDKRWWVALAGAAGGLAGSVVGALLK